MRKLMFVLALVLVAMSNVACGLGATSSVTYERKDGGQLVYDIYRLGEGPVEYRATMSDVPRPYLGSNFLEHKNVPGIIQLTGSIPISADGKMDDIDQAVTKARDIIKKEFDAMMKDLERLRL